MKRVEIREVEIATETKGKVALPVSGAKENLAAIESNTARKWQ
jgi:hypothetical protein